MKEKKFHLRNDVIFIALLLAISAVAFLYLFEFGNTGTTVRVTVDGREYGTYCLDENITESIVTGEKGQNINSFVISDGKVSMVNATCPDGICVAHRPIYRDGESIVCLPNRVVITVIDNSDTENVDIVA